MADLPWTDGYWALAVLLYEIILVEEGNATLHKDVRLALAEATVRSFNSWWMRMANFKAANGPGGLKGNDKTVADCRSWQRQYREDPLETRRLAASVLHGNPLGVELAKRLAIPVADLQPALVSGDSEAPSRQFWVVQTNPKKFQIDIALRDPLVADRFEWSVPQHSSKMRIGDQVAVWRSNGLGGLEAAVVAFATIVTEAHSGTPDATDKYWTSRTEQDAATQVPKVSLRIDALVEPPVTRTILADDPGTSGLLFVKGNMRQTVTQIDQQAYDSLLALSGLAEPPSAAQERLDPPMPDILSRLDFDWLATETSLPDGLLREIVASLSSRKPQVILAGVPGTGKTFVAQALARAMTGGTSEHGSSGRSEWQLVQFHPSYSYEQFVQGLRPTVDENGAVRFAVQNGHLLEIDDYLRRQQSPQGPYVLIIDEMNRANLPRVLGELLYLLEYRDESIHLQYAESGKTFSMPRRLALIGTMNTADRSIRTIDAALRRRFDVFVLEPSAGTVRAHYARHDTDIDVESLVSVMEELNWRLRTDLNEHHQIGHTFFMHDHLTKESLTKTWKRQILPLLCDYCIGEDSNSVEAKYGKRLSQICGFTIRGAEQLAGLDESEGDFDATAVG